MESEDIFKIIALVLISLIIISSHINYNTVKRENVELSITLQKTEHKLVEKTNEVKMLEEQIAELKGE